jgi:hypothetical protein
MESELGIRVDNNKSEKNERGLKGDKDYISKRYSCFMK